MTITRAHFSMQAAYLAGRANSWCGELLGLPENLNEPMRDESVKRFTNMLRKTADHIEQMHRETD